MTTSIITQQDIPSHRLSIKIFEDEDGQEHRVFYLNEKQAEWLAKNINSADRFIVLPKEVDPNAPSFYPKTWARMEKMTNEEIEARRDKYMNIVDKIKDENIKKERSEAAMKVRKWIQDHPTEWEDSLLLTEAELKSNKGGHYSFASENIKKSLVWYESMRKLDLEINKNLNQPENQN